MQKFGIDVSVWQRYIDFNQAKNEGVEFVIIRAMYGNAKDTQFENLYSKAKANGLPCGAYIWGRAKTEAQAREEAQILIEDCLQGKKFEYPIYYDVEDSILISLSVDDLTKVISAWASQMEKAGYFAGVYMNTSCFNNEVRGSELAKKYTQWRASWGKNKPDGVSMWQFGGETNLLRSNQVAGMTCDQDYAYEDFPTTMQKVGLNGYVKVVAEPIVETPIEEEPTPTKPVEDTPVVDEPIENDIPENSEKEADTGTETDEPIITPTEQETSTEIGEIKPSETIWQVIVQAIINFIINLLKGGK